MNLIYLRAKILKTMKRAITLFSILLLCISTFSQTFDFKANVTEGCPPQFQVVFSNLTDESIRDEYSYEWFCNKQEQYSPLSDNVKYTYSEPGSYDVVLKVYDKNKTTLITTISKKNYITVHNRPEVTIKSNKKSDCWDRPFTFSVASVKSDAAIKHYNWKVNDDDMNYDSEVAEHEFMMPGNYEIYLEVEDKNGCKGESAPITITAEDVYVSFYAEPRTTCASTLGVNFHNNSKDADIATYRWDFGDGSSSYTGKTPPKHTYNGYGEYDAVLHATSKKGCEVEVSTRIVLTDYEPEIEIRDESPEVEFDTANYGTYIEADSLNPCPCKNVTEVEYKVITSGVKACAGNVVFTDVTNDPLINSWQWALYKKDGTENILIAESEDPSFSAELLGSGMYMVTLKNSNGSCSKETNRIFYVEEPLEITIEPKADFYCSVPVTIDYKATSNVPGTQFLWRFGNTERMYIGSDYSATYYSDGSYVDRVYAISPNFCRYSTVTEKPLVIATPNINNIEVTPTSGCKPLEVDFSATYYYNTELDSIKTITWYFGDREKNKQEFSFDTLSQKGRLSTEFTYVDTGVFVPYLQIETYNGCKKDVNISRTNQVKVGEKPDITITYDKELMCASDSLMATVTFNGGIERYLSDFDTLRITHISEREREYVEEKIPVEKEIQIRLKDTLGNYSSSFFISDNGCNLDEQDAHIVAVSGPIINVSASPTDCDNPYHYTYKLTKKLDVESWEWYKAVVVMGKEISREYVASNVDSVVMVFPNRGYYKMIVVAHNSESDCDMEESVMTHVTDIKGDFDFEGINDGDTAVYCLNDYVKFALNTDMGQDISFWGWYYNWQDVENSITFALNSSAEIVRYDKEYVTIEIDSCSGESKEVIHQPDEKYLYRLDLEEINQITVVAYDEHFCTDTVRKPVAIASPRAVFVGDTLENCLPFETTFTDTSSSKSIITQRIWTVDGNVVSRTNEKSISVDFTTPGYKTVSLEVTGVSECTDKVTKNAYVKPVVPNTNFSVVNPKVCLNHEATFIRNLNVPERVNTLSRYKWEFGDADTLIEGDLPEKTVRTYETASKKLYNVKLIGYVMGPYGQECVDTTTRELDVKKVYTSLEIKNSDLCKSDRLNLNISSSSVKTFTWWKIDGGDSVYIGNQKNMSFITFDNFGMQQLGLRSQSEYYGCEDTVLSFPVIVPGGVKTDLVASKDSACIREDVQFRLTQPENLFLYDCWLNFGDGEEVPMTTDTISHAYTDIAKTADNTYKAQFYVDDGCGNVTSTNVMIIPILADFVRGGDTDVDTIGCPPYTVTMYNRSIADESASYLWRFADGTTSTEKSPTVTVNDLNSSIPVTLELTSRVCNDKVTKNIHTYAPANVSVNMDTVFCVGTSIRVTATGDFNTIEWIPNELFSSSRSPMTDINMTKSQYIYIKTTNQYNCKNTDSIYVYVQQKPYYFGAPDTDVLFYNSDGTLAQTSGNSLLAGQVYNFNVQSVPGVSYVWSPDTYLSCTNCVSPDLDLSCEHEDCMSFPETIEYTVLMQDSLGCFKNDTTIQFSIILDTKIGMPEAFTPNNDGKNDIAYVRGWGIREFVEVKIYNRWGQLVFESDDMAKGWDGTFNGEPQSMDTYAYTIKAIGMDDKEIFVKGYISLLR